MKKIKWLMTIALLFPLIAIAGAGQEGNGGDGIFCSVNGKKSVQFFDLYEAEKLYGRKLDLGSSQLTTKEKLELALKRLARIDQARAQVLKKLAQDFWQNTFFTDDDLADLPDAGLGSFPAGCQIKQVAIQKTPIFPGAKLYTIDRKLWNLMNSDSQAALVLHEIVLNTVRDSNASYGQKQFRDFHTDTQRVRYYTGWLTSSEVATISLGDYTKILNLSALDSSMTYRGFNLTWQQKLNHEKTMVSGEPEFFDTGKNLVKTAFIADPHLFTIPMGSGSLLMKFTFQGRISFHQNGQASVIDSFSNPSVHDEIQIPINNGYLIWPENKINSSNYSEEFKFDDRGILTTMRSVGEFKNNYAESSGAFTIKRSGNTYFVSAITGDGTLAFKSKIYSLDDDSSVLFYETGELAAVSQVPMTVKTIFGEIESSDIEFYPTGNVKSLAGAGEDKTLKIQINGVNLEMQRKNRISFYENGSIFSAVMSKETAGLKDPTGKAITVFARERFNLDVNGAVTCTGRSCP